MPPKTERRPRQGRETRERILDATIEIAAERGYDGTTMSATAKRVELLVSSTYWHFTDNDDLIAAVILPSFEAWLQTAVQWVHRYPGCSGATTSPTPYAARRSHSSPIPSSCASR